MQDIKWKYTGPIFDAHTHVWNTSYLSETIKEQTQLGIKAQIVIIHQGDIRNIVEDYFPGKFVFAKYLSTQSIVSYKIGSVIRDIEMMRENGFSLAKMWVAPAWRNYTKNLAGRFSLTDKRLEPLFTKLANEEFPLLLHVADPDTYYATTYSNSKIYGTKEEHLNQLEELIQKYPNLIFQLAHFGAQPEIHRLAHLGAWFDSYSNIFIDTASSRWMSRELSRNPRVARKFLIKYSNRILFGTDATLNTPLSKAAKGLNGNQLSLSPYGARLLAQRILWETKKRNIPLPLPDPDTETTGGTFINGLNLPKVVLENLYWRNANRLYPR